MEKMENSKRIKINEVLDFILLYLLLFQVMFFRWLGMTGYINKIIMLLIVCSMVANIYTYWRIGAIPSLILIIFYFIWSYFYFGGSDYIIINNLKEISPPLLIMFYLSFIILYKKKLLEKFYNNILIILNLYMIVNIPVMLLQLSGNYWLSGITTQTNSFSQDMISGLLGFNGVPMLTIFSIFVIIYNNQYSMRLRGNARIIFKAYNIFLLAFQMIISLYNDNKGFYLIIVLMFALYKIFEKIYDGTNYRMLSKIRNKILNQKTIFLLILLIFLILFAYYLTPFGQSINDMIYEFNLGINKQNAVQGSSERFGIIALVLSTPALVNFGAGLAMYTWTTPFTLGFPHFGQSDFGSFIALGGVCFVLILFVIFFLLFKKVTGNSKLLSSLVIILFLVLSVYSQIFTVSSLMISTMLYLGRCII